MKKQLTLTEAKQLVGTNFTLKRTVDSEVVLKGRRGTPFASVEYFTDDLQDAVDTANFNARIYAATTRKETR